MQKKNALAMPVAFMIFVSAINLPAYCQTPDVAFEKLKIELKVLGVSDEFIRITKDSVKKMISYAAPIGDIKTVLLDLWSQGVKGRALANATTAVAELVASGDNVLAAAKIASAAARQAESEGLSGLGTGLRVRKAVQERKAYLKALKGA